METERKTSRDIEHLDLETLLRRPSLRANIPRRVSQAWREAAPVEGTTCGVGCIRGEWLQSFANRKSYIFIYGVLGSFYGSYYAYFYGTLTTLEKRFKMQSQTLGMIATISDLIQIILSWVLFLFVPKLHKPRWIGAGIYLVVGSTVISSLPHFLYGPGEGLIQFLKGSSISHKNQSLQDHRQCFEDSCPEEENERTVLLLIVAQILHGIGGTLYFTLGRIYSDENIQKYQAPSLLSLLSILKILGPAFGYWLSSICLKIFVSPSLTVTADEEEVHWIGAWWLGNLIIGFLLLIPGVMVTLFPMTLPKAAVGKIFNEAMEMSQTQENKSESREKEKSSRSLFINSTFKCNNLTTVFNFLGFMPYFIFLPKYVETQYRLSASSANLIIGSVTLIFSACGVVIGNSIITRYRPPARALVSWKVFTGIMSIGSLISYVYLGCHGNDEQIKAMVTQYAHGLNSTCSCTNSFSPVCDESGESFVTPCHAQCNSYNETQITTNCLLTPKACPVDCYYNFLIFTIITSSTSFFYATGYTSNIWLETKYTETPRKSLVINLGMALLSLVAFVPVPITFGYILDNSCLLWNEACNGTGNCWLYDTKNLRSQMNLIAVGFAVLGIIHDVGVLYSVKDIKLFDDEQYIDEFEEH